MALHLCEVLHLCVSSRRFRRFCIFYLSWCFAGGLAVLIGDRCLQNARLRLRLQLGDVRLPADSCNCLLLCWFCLVLMRVVVVAALEAIVREKMECGEVGLRSKRGVGLRSKMGSGAHLVCVLPILACPRPGKISAEAPCASRHLGLRPEI